MADSDQDGTGTGSAVTLADLAWFAETFADLQTLRSWLRLGGDVSSLAIRPGQ